MREIDLRNVDRVIIDDQGTSVPSFAAWKTHGVRSDYIFIRSDGWMLGAPSEFYDVALNMWLDEWETIIIFPWVKGIR